MRDKNASRIRAREKKGFARGKKGFPTHSRDFLMRPRA
jgi:hypothetical protein